MMYYFLKGRRCQTPSVFTLETYRCRSCTCLLQVTTLRSQTQGKEISSAVLIFFLYRGASHTLNVLIYFPGWETSSKHRRKQPIRVGLEHSLLCGGIYLFLMQTVWRTTDLNHLLINPSWALRNTKIRRKERRRNWWSVE